MCQLKILEVIDYALDWNWNMGKFDKFLTKSQKFEGFIKPLLFKHIYFTYIYSNCLCKIYKENRYN